MCIIASTLPSQEAYAQTKEANVLENLGPQINSVYEETNPIISPDGNTLYFCRGRHPENIGGRRDVGDIWFSEKDELGNWQKAKNIGAPINNIHKNDLAGISADGNTLFLHYNYGSDGKSFLQGLSYSKKSPSGWSKPEKLDIPYFYNASDHQSVFISHDEKIVLFSIDSYGTFGAEDLYVSFKTASGTYSEPMNLGPQINTENQEITPFLSRDNQTLFFVTNGRKGVGSKDIFKTQRLDDTWKNWSEPENLGRHINTEGMEMYYHQDPESMLAYIVSTRNSDGYGDIYQLKIREQDLPKKDTDVNFLPDLALVNEGFEDAMFQVPDTVIVFKMDPEAEVDEDEEIEEMVKHVDSKSIYGRVYNGATQKGLLASISFESNGEIKKISSKEENGAYEINLQNPGQYKFTITSKGHMSKEAIVEILELDSIKELNFHLTPLEIGTTIQLHDVLFEQGAAKMLDDSFPELDKIAEMLLENPNLYIELAGHTDNQGIAKLNIKLSQERVENVKKYLVEKGVDAKRISGKGYGGVKPIASNKNEETRKLNRRVEFTIVKN